MQKDPWAGYGLGYDLSKLTSRRDFNSPDLLRPDYCGCSLSDESNPMQMIQINEGMGSALDPTTVMAALQPCTAHDGNDALHSRRPCGAMACLCICVAQFQALFWLVCTRHHIGHPWAG